MSEERALPSMIYLVFPKQRNPAFQRELLMNTENSALISVDKFITGIFATQPLKAPLVGTPEHVEYLPLRLFPQAVRLPNWLFVF
jgi:hypothetical protein